jgi:hypothetical protein
MPVAASLPRRAARLAGLVLLSGMTTAVAQDRVGINSAVNQAATGAPSGASARPLVIGQDVVFNERIATNAAGQAQLLFLDKSAMTIGPNSDLTIDQFVYDPKSGTGKLAMSATRGVLRYVGGKLSKQDDAVTLRTTVATIAIRGGAFVAEQTAGGQLNVYFIYGRTVSVIGANNVTETMRRPGFAISVSGPGAPPSPPYPAPAGALAQLIAQLDGRPGGTGGAQRAPSDASILASGIGRMLSDNVAATLLAAAQSRPPLIQPTLINPADLPTIFQLNTITGSEELGDAMGLENGVPRRP